MASETDGAGDKRTREDDAAVRRAGEELLRGFRMLKQVVLVGADVDLFSEEDVWWAMTTRFQADRDLVLLSDQLGFPLDPSQHPEYSPSLTARGRTCKAVLDCTVPFAQRARFARAAFGASARHGPSPGDRHERPRRPRTPEAG